MRHYDCLCPFMVDLFTHNSRRRALDNDKTTILLPCICITSFDSSNVDFHHIYRPNRTAAKFFFVIIRFTSEVKQKRMKFKTSGETPKAVTLINNGR